MLVLIITGIFIHMGHIRAGKTTLNMNTGKIYVMKKKSAPFGI